MGKREKRTRNWLKLVFQEQRQQWNNVFIWRCILQLGLSKIANAVNEGERTSSRGGRKNEVADPFVSFFLFSLSHSRGDHYTHTQRVCCLLFYLLHKRKGTWWTTFILFFLSFWKKKKNICIYTQSRRGEKEQVKAAWRRRRRRSGRPFSPTSSQHSNQP